MSLCQYYTTSLFKLPLSSPFIFPSNASPLRFKPGVHLLIFVRDMDSILAIAFLLAELCISQSMPTTPAFVESISFSCGSCEFAAATLPPSSVSSLSDISTAIPTASYVVFTAYSISSEYSSNEFCMTTLGSSITVSPRYSVLKPASIPALVFLPTAVNSLVDYLGFSACTPGGEHVISVTIISSLSLTGSSPSANTTSTESPTPSTGTLFLGIQPKHPFRQRLITA